MTLWFLLTSPLGLHDDLPDQWSNQEGACHVFYSPCKESEISERGLTMMEPRAVHAGQDQGTQELL